MLSFVLPLVAYCLSYPIMIISMAKVELGLLFFVTLIPVITAMKKIEVYPGGHNIADFLLVAMVIGWIRNTVKENRAFLISSPVNIVVTIIVLSSFMSYINGTISMSFSEEINLLRLKTWKNYMILPVIYFIVANNLRTEKIIKIAIICISLTLLVTDFNFYSTFKWIKTYHYSHDLRIGGSFSFLGPNEMGIFYAMNTFFLIGILYFIENKKYKYFIFFTVAVSFYPIIYSYSRTAYICSLFGLLTVGLLRDKKLLVLLIAILLFYRIVLPVSVIERIDMTMLDKATTSSVIMEKSAFNIGGSTIEITGRKLLWEKAMNHFKAHPIFGTGFDTFRHIEGKIPHGLYHKLLAEQGVIGFFIHILFLLTILRQSLRLYRFGRNKLDRGIGLGFFASAILYAVGTTSGDMSLYYNLMAIFWFFLGVVERLNYDRQNSSDFVPEMKYAI